MIINAAEHAWVIGDPRFPIDLELASCPSRPPKSDYTAEHLISEMKLYGIDLLVGHRLFAPDDSENPDRLSSAMQEQGLAGLRLSPIYDKASRWFDDPMMYPFWERAQELGAVFNIFLGPDQVEQVASMAERFPGVKVVIDHIAMIDITAPDEAGFGQLLEMNRLSNVYVRTSLHNPSREATPYRDVWPFLKRIYHAFGPERMLYANFFEYLIMKEMIPFFTETDKVWILGRTAEGIYWGGRE